MRDFERARKAMVERQIAARGIDDDRVLGAMRTVPREAFVPDELREWAYEDGPLPIGEGQTISQPFIVALMVHALGLEGGERVLEIGAGSGYAVAVLAEIAGRVYAVERHRPLLDAAAERLQRLGVDNVEMRHGDGTLGWSEQAPFDAILVSAGAPDVPPALLEQLAVGGRLVLPVGDAPREQRLLRVTRVAGDEYREEELDRVSFVPLVGQQGWQENGEKRHVQPAVIRHTPRDGNGSLMASTGATGGVFPSLAGRIATAAERFDAIAGADLGALLERIADSSVVLIGEASHGTSEFYRMRAHITRELISRHGFSIVAVEADWPDAKRVDRFVRELPGAPPEWRAFERFPSWMWRNREVREFVDWLHAHNRGVQDPAARTGFFGLDLYSLHTSIAEVLAYLDRVDPDAARVARARYGCLSPWERDPAVYGRAALSGGFERCQRDVVAMLTDLLGKRLEYSLADGEAFFDVVSNAHLIADAERYYRAMYHGSRESWNLRDSHMFETLERLIDNRGPDARAVVWAHNSHLGDASATEMGAWGEHNVGQLSRRRFGDAAYLIGFGTDRGTVAAADDWDEPMRVMDVRPAHEESYERLCRDSRVASFLLPLREGQADEGVREGLSEERLERAIGVVYRPETELASHYFRAVLPRQFDEYVWFEQTRAITPLGPTHLAGVAATYPFGL